MRLTILLLLLSITLVNAQPPGNFRYLFFTGVADSMDVPGVANPLMGIAGTMYYNNQSDKFRCFENGAWVDCSGGGNLSGTLTPPRIPYAGTATTLVDDALLQWDNTNKAILIGNFGRIWEVNNSSYFFGGLAGTSLAGIRNTGIGNLALSALNTGQDNTALGAQAGAGITSGIRNVFIGVQAGLVAGGNDNTVIGDRAGLVLSTGEGNIFVGRQSGANTTTGSRNVVIGFQSHVPVATTSFQLNLMNAIYGTNLSGTAQTISTGNIGFYNKTPTHKVTLTATGANSDIFLVENDNGRDLLRIEENTDVDELITDVDNFVGGAVGGTSLQVSTATETAILSSSAGSSLTTDVNQATETRITTDANGLFVTSTGVTETANVILQGDPQTISFGGSTPGSSLTVNASVNGVVQLIPAHDLLIVPENIAGQIDIQTFDGATGTDPTQPILLRTGSVNSGTGAVGDIEIRLGAQVGSGSPGAIQIDVNNGELIFTITRTDCTGAPSGAIANVAGVLNICP